MAGQIFDDEWAVFSRVQAASRAAAWVGHPAGGFSAFICCGFMVTMPMTPICRKIRLSPDRIIPSVISPLRRHGAGCCQAASKNRPVSASKSWPLAPDLELHFRGCWGCAAALAIHSLVRLKGPFLGADLRFGTAGAEGGSRCLRRDPAARAQRGSWVEGVLTHNPPQATL